MLCIPTTAIHALILTFPFLYTSQFLLADVFFGKDSIFLPGEKKTLVVSQISKETQYNPM